MIAYIEQIGGPPWLGLVLLNGLGILAILAPLVLLKMAASFWRTGSHSSDIGSMPNGLGPLVGVVAAALSWYCLARSGVLASRLDMMSETVFPGAFRGFGTIPFDALFNDAAKYADDIVSWIEPYVARGLNLIGLTPSNDVDQIISRVVLGVLGVLGATWLFTSLGQHLLVVFLTGSLAVLFTIPAAISIGNGGGLAVAGGLALFALYKGLRRKDAVYEGFD